MGGTQDGKSEGQRRAGQEAGMRQDGRWQPHQAGEALKRKTASSSLWSPSIVRMRCNGGLLHLGWGVLQTAAVSGG